MSEVPQNTHHRDVLAWAQAAIEEGEAFLRSCSGYDKIDDTINAIMGDWTGEARPPSLSQIHLNHFGKCALDLAAAETDIKPFWDYRTKNKKFEQQSQLAQKYAEAWWYRRHISPRFSDVIKYANAAGTGYSHHVFDSELGDQTIIAEDPRDVIPIRPGSFASIQEAFGVMIRRERTVNYLRHKYPKAANQIRADRDASFNVQQKNTRVGRLLASMGMKSAFVENLYASLGGRPAAQQMNVPTADTFTCYVNDDSTNETGQTVWMGLLDPNGGPVQGNITNWSYRVEPGEKLYPRKRCLIFTRTALLYDDTSIYWHGLFPVSKLTLDPWPWSWLGKAPLKDLLPLQAELNRLMRMVSQHHQRIERPGIAADKNSLSRAAMQAIDTAKAGLKLRHNPIAGKGVELLHEPPLDASVQTTILFIIDQIKELSGVRDATRLMNLGQVPASETVDRIMETMSPSIRLRSRVIENFMSEFAMMTLMNIFQFATLPERVSVLGPIGMTFDDFDYDPGTMLPDLMDLYGTQPNGDPLPRDERARKFIHNFSYQIAPGSLLASAGVTEKMLYVQLARMGWIDLWTALDKLGIPNVGEPPGDAVTITDRLKAQAAMGLGMQQSAAGRPPSAQGMPRMTMKES